MRFEVSLLRWSERDGSVRVLGRTSDRNLVEVVRSFLAGDLDGREGGSLAALFRTDADRDHEN